MLGVRLRSDKIDQFDVLGERGQAIHLVASQILTVLKSKRPDLLAHFAVPQSSENGSRIDWYAPSPGSVVVWNAATAGEQAGALARLESVRAGVAQLRDSIQAKGSSNDAALLGQLLKWIMHHPDPSFVFLVGGQPVITFWGFLHSGADRSLDPLHALRPAAPLSSPSHTPVVETVATTAANTATTTVHRIATSGPWWKRWWTWLLLLLSLLALLFGLRACMPNLMPNLSLPGVTPRGDMTLPDAKLSMPTLPNVDAGAANGLGGAAQSRGGDAAGGLPSPNAPNAPNVPNPPSTPDSAASAPNPPESLADPAAGPPPAQFRPDGAGPQPAANGAADPGNAAPPTLPDSKDALQIPENASDGSANFLNGNWRAGAGIQDRDTGEPLRLHYQFKNGEGQVTVNRHNGVQCTAPVSAAMSKGSLSISNSVAAKCSDGGTYDMPLIQCNPAAQNIASCAGQYGDERFPISMRRAQP